MCVACAAESWLAGLVERQHALLKSKEFPLILTFSFRSMSWGKQQTRSSKLCMFYDSIVFFLSSSSSFFFYPFFFLGGWGVGGSVECVVGGGGGGGGGGGYSFCGTRERKLASLVIFI